MTKRTDNSRRRNAGSTLVEISVAIMLMAVLGTTLAEGLVARHALRAHLDRRQIARCEAANELQRVAALRWDELLATKNGPASLSQTAKDALPNARMTTRLETPANDPDARQIHVELKWLGPLTGQPEAPIRLTAWAYKSARRQSP